MQNYSTKHLMIFFLFSSIFVLLVVWLCSSSTYHRLLVFYQPQRWSCNTAGGGRVTPDNHDHPTKQIYVIKLFQFTSHRVYPPSLPTEFTCRPAAWSSDGPRPCSCSLGGTYSILPFHLYFSNLANFSTSTST